MEANCRIKTDLMLVLLRDSIQKYMKSQHSVIYFIITSVCSTYKLYSFLLVNENPSFTCFELILPHINYYFSVDSVSEHNIYICITAYMYETIIFITIL